MDGGHWPLDRRTDGGETRRQGTLLLIGERQRGLREYESEHEDITPPLICQTSDHLGLLYLHPHTWANLLKKEEDKGERGVHQR